MRLHVYGVVDRIFREYSIAAERGDGSWAPVLACLSVSEFDQHGLGQLDTPFGVAHVIA